MKEWTPTQLVAYNLARARQLRAWTQEEAASELARYQSGVKWSRSAWSVAEHSVDGRRVRQFTADDLVAFSLAFRLPMTWWFMPPGPDEPDVMVVIGSAKSEPDGLATSLFSPHPDVQRRLVADNRDTGTTSLQSETESTERQIENVTAMLDFVTDHLRRLQAQRHQEGVTRHRKGKR